MAERILIAEDDEDLAFVAARGADPQGLRGRGGAHRGRMLDTPQDRRMGPHPPRRAAARHGRARRHSRVPRSRPGHPIIVMTAHGTREVATEAISRGAHDFFTKPLKMTEFQVVVARALERRRLQLQIKALQAAQGSGFEELVGKSESLKRVVEMAQRAAPADVTVLIEGESGTGKEVLARGIHRLTGAQGRSPHSRQLRGHPRGASRVGAVRPRARRLHRRGARQAGALRAGPRGHHLPRRDRRHAALHAGEDPPRLAGARDRAGGRYQVHPHRRARGGGHPPESRAARHRRKVPRRSLLPTPGRTAPPPSLRERLDDLPELIGAPARPDRAAHVARGRHGVSRGAALSLGLSVAGQCPRAAARARGGHGDVRWRHPARAPAARHPAGHLAAARRSGPRAGGARSTRRSRTGSGR